MRNLECLLSAVHGIGEFDVLDVNESTFHSLIQQISDTDDGIDLFFWLLAQRQKEVAMKGAVHLLKCLRDPATLAEIVDQLSLGCEKFTEVNRALWETFVNIAEGSGSPYGLRAQSLRGALLLSQSCTPLLRRFQGVLLDFDCDEDCQFLRHVVKIIGVILAHDSNDIFREKIKSLITIEGIEDEVSMELGLDALRRGLASVSHEDATSRFNEARNWFFRAVNTSECRIDAELYLCCVNVLMSVQNKGFCGDLAECVNDLKVAAFQYAAFLLHSDRRVDGNSWLGSLTIEGRHWTSLGLRLGALDLSLTKRIWINVGLIVEDELFSIYRSSRSFFLNDGDSGLDLVLRPKIVDTFIMHRRHLEELDQWIVESADSLFLADMLAMREEVQDALEKSVVRANVVTNEDQNLTKILSAGQLSVSSREVIDGRLRRISWMQELDDNPVISRMDEKIFSGLIEANEDCRTIREVEVLCQAVLFYSLCFLNFRHNVGCSTDPNAKYLFVRKPAELPLESALQQDYFRFLNGTSLRDVIQTEVSDVASGRADIYFTYRGVKMIVEIKRSDQAYDHIQLLNVYGAQAAAYQSTNVTIGFLLVLDLYDREGSQPHFNEQISHQRKKIEGQSTEYDIVVMRVQGQRVTPSKQR